MRLSCLLVTDCILICKRSMGLSIFAGHSEGPKLPCRRFTIVFQTVIKMFDFSDVQKVFQFLKPLHLSLSSLEQIWHRWPTFCACGNQKRARNYCYCVIRRNCHTFLANFKNTTEILRLKPLFITFRKSKKYKNLNFHFIFPRKTRKRGPVSTALWRSSSFQTILQVCLYHYHKGEKSWTLHYYIWIQ